MGKWKFRKKYRVRNNEFSDNVKFNFSRLIKRELFFTIISIMAVTTAILGGSYAVFSSIQKADNYNIIKTGTLQIAYDDTATGLGNIINLNGAYPETDAVGQAREPYKFKITNTGSITSKYKVRIIDDTDMITEDNCSTNQLPKDKIKYSINGNEPALLSTKEAEYIVEEGTLTAGKDKTYELRMWIDDNAGNEVLGKHYHGKIVVEAVQGKELLVNHLLEKTNPVEVVDYNAGNKVEMFTFTHTAGEQQAGYTSDELTDYRYIGKTPNNYVTFNNEVWRIIGIFTVENENGVKEKRIKIVRDQPIGDYSWDTSESAINGGWGINKWSQADLMKLLNPGHTGVGGSLYYNKQSGICYSGKNNATTTCDFTATGLSEEAKNMIGDTKWWLGGSSEYLHSSPTYYAFERGNTVMTNPTDGITRSTSWIGKVGLMYPSDYAYTYANGVDNKCYTDTYNCYGGTPSSGWLFNSKDQWLLSPKSSYARGAFYVYQTGFVNDGYSGWAFGVRPGLYLKPAIEIASGNGSSITPYTLK